MMNMNKEKRRFSLSSLILGILFLLGSYFAFTNPDATFETFALFFSIVIILYGVYQVLIFFRLRNQTEDQPITWVNLLAGIFAVAIGIYFLINPTAGTSVLTALFAVWFLLIFIQASFRLRLLGGLHPGIFWFSLILNVLGVLLGIFLLIHPIYSFLTVTTMLALGLLLAGISLIIDSFIS